jgi:hypothetical protein
MKKTFAGIVKRTDAWDHSKEAHEQEGFHLHAAFVSQLEADGFVHMAGLMEPSNDVLFIFFADSEEQLRERMAQDPWQQDGHAKLVRLEEVAFRIGTPQPREN